MYIILSQYNFFGKKLIIFRKGGVGGGTLFTENSAKLINLIFEPFPYPVETFLTGNSDFLCDTILQLW